MTEISHHPALELCDGMDNDCDDLFLWKNSMTTEMDMSNAPFLLRDGRVAIQKHAEEIVMIVMPTPIFGDKNR